MKNAFAALSCATLIVVGSPAPAFAHDNTPCDQPLCIRHCLSWHRGLDRVLCLIDHNIQN